MTNMILVYTTCKNMSDARKTGKHLLQKRLCACINILPQMESCYFWPPKSNQLESADEVVLIIKTLADRYEDVEQEIFKVCSYTNPSIFALPVIAVSQKYMNWIEGEVK